jgi:hypothetical protein
MARRCEKRGFLLWIFAEGREIGGVYWGLLVSNKASFEGRRGGEEGQGAGVVQQVWMGVEMWEMWEMGARDGG